MNRASGVKCANRLRHRFAQRNVPGKSRLFLRTQGVAGQDRAGGFAPGGKHKREAAIRKAGQKPGVGQVEPYGLALERGDSGSLPHQIQSGSGQLGQPDIRAGAAVIGRGRKGRLYSSFGGTEPSAGKIAGLVRVDDGLAQKANGGLAGLGGYAELGITGLGLMPFNRERPWFIHPRQGRRRDAKSLANRPYGATYSLTPTKQAIWTETAPHL